MYSRFLDIMRKAGIELDVTELAEALWLARIAPLASGAAGRGAASDMTGEADSAGQQQPAEAASAPAKAAEAPSRTMAAYAKGDAGDEGIPAAELLLPAASPLSNPAAAAIGRALRPLARRRDSRSDRLFDEEATADASGETGVVTPVFRPAPERWFSVAVVMEETASMAVWQELAEEMERLFAQHGGFNQATRWRLRFEGDNDSLVAPDGSLQPVSHLHRLGERQMILMMTDGASSRWDDGRMAGVLHQWGRVCPVVILQVVAERMWRNTRLGVPTALVKSHQPGSRNSDLSHWPRSAWVKPKKNAMAFPIVALDPELIAEWAGMIMHPGVHFTAVTLTPAKRAEAAPPVERSAKDRLIAFHARASDDAYRLAIYLSFMPLTLPVMRTVQAARLRDASPALLSELLLGGIIRRTDAGAPIEHPDKLRLDFHDGVRALLNPRIGGDEIPPLLHLVADYLSRLTGRRHTISALMPYIKGDKRLPHADALPFARFLRDGLKRAGWLHLSDLDDAPDEADLLLTPFPFDTVTLDKTGKEIDRRSPTAYQYVEDLGPGVALEMVEIAGGEFEMGGNEYDDEKPVHRVKVSPFFMGKHPVTQAQWRAIAVDRSLKIKLDLDPDPSRFKGANLPVETVSWEEAVEFCARLSKKTGREYRLPTEAEWEYACRAGTTTPFAFGETITPGIVNYYAGEKKGEHRGQTTPVGSLGVANAFGLYDMHGNVWEWCADWYGDKYYEECHAQGVVADPRGPSRGSDRVDRGGGWNSGAVSCRSADRDHDAPGHRLGDLGFRLLRTYR